MVEIEKGGPRQGLGPARTELGDLIRELAASAHADKGEWYSVEQPSDMRKTGIHSVINNAVAGLVAQQSTKDNRIWIRFHKDSDGSA